jgi:hypothetical protein
MDTAVQYIRKKISKQKGVDAFVVTGEAVARVLRVVIRSCITEPVEAIRVLEF